MENNYAKYAKINPEDAKRVFDVYDVRRGQLLSRDAVTDMVKKFGITDNNVLAINSFFGASYQAPINFIHLDKGGCVFDSDITKEEAYEAIDSAIETAKMISSKSYIPARKASA